MDDDIRKNLAKIDGQGITMDPMQCPGGAVILRTCTIPTYGSSYQIDNS